MSRNIIRTLHFGSAAVITATAGDVGGPKRWILCRRFIIAPLECRLDRDVPQRAAAEEMNRCSGELHVRLHRMYAVRFTADIGDLD